MGPLNLEGHIWSSWLVGVFSSGNFSAELPSDGHHSSAIRVREEHMDRNMGSETRQAAGRASSGFWGLSSLHRFLNSSLRHVTHWEEYCLVVGFSAATFGVTLDGLPKGLYESKSAQDWAK